MTYFFRKNKKKYFEIVIDRLTFGRRARNGNYYYFLNCIT